MSDLRIGAQQALEALEKVGLRADARRGCDEAVGILRAALAQQDEPLNLTDPAVQKRLAAQWGYVHDTQQALTQQKDPTDPGNDVDVLREHARHLERRVRQLHAQQAEPQGCATEEDCTKQPWCRIRGTCQRKQAEPAQEPVAWKQGNLVTFNEDPCPVLGGLFVQFWDGEEVAARVYANDLKTLRQRCAKVNTAPPQRKPLPKHDQHCVDVPGYGLTAVRLVRAVERAHGIKE